jgi:hypothetical protein
LSSASNSSTHWLCFAKAATNRLALFLSIPL